MKPSPYLLPDGNVQMCSVSGCDNPHDAKGFCRPHYSRWKRHGDPLAGRTPNGALIAFLKSAADSQTDECILWPFARYEHGHGMVRFHGTMMRASRAVLLIAGRTPNSPQDHAAHKPVVCHQPACVNPRHIDFVPCQENADHRKLDGTSNVGERNGAAKLTREQVIAIRRSVDSYAALSARYGVAEPTINSIRSRQTWAWLEDFP